MRDNYLLSVKKSIVDFVLRDPRANLNAKMVEIPPHRKVNNGCHGDHYNQIVFCSLKQAKVYDFVSFICIQEGRKNRFRLYR